MTACSTPSSSTSSFPAPADFKITPEQVARAQQQAGKCFDASQPAIESAAFVAINSAVAYSEACEPDFAQLSKPLAQPSVVHSSVAHVAIPALKGSAKVSIQSTASSYNGSLTAAGAASSLRNDTAF